MNSNGSSLSAVVLLLSVVAGNDQADVHGCLFTRRRHQHHHTVIGLFLSLLVLHFHAHSVQHHLLAGGRGDECSEHLQCERDGAQELSGGSHAAARRIYAHARWGSSSFIRSFVCCMMFFSLSQIEAYLTFQRGFA